jgi:hypothetical protein
MSYLFLFLFLVPIVALCWRVIVSKTRSSWLRIGAAGTAMASTVGAFMIFDDLSDFEFKDWRSDVALLAAMSASLYLLAWSLLHSGNRRHRTTSVIAAIIGLVPVIGTLASAVIFGRELG